VDSICCQFVCISCSILILSADGILSIPIIQSITDCASGDNGVVDPGIHGVPVDHAHVISLYNPGLSLRMIAVCSDCCCSAVSCWNVVPCGIPARDITCCA
jgi:hypothetical protein